MSEQKSFQNVPVWLRVIGRIAQCLSLFIVFPALIFGYVSSAASNVLLAVLMVAIVAVVVSRLSAVAHGNLVWRFWTATRWALFGSVVRVLFYISAALVIYYGTVHRVLGLEAETWIIWVPLILSLVLIVLSIIPRRYPNWPVTVFSALMTPILFGMVIFGLREPQSEVFTVTYPLATESYVVHGGASLLTNYHYLHQSQRHALDMGDPLKSGIPEEGDALTDDKCFGAPLIAVATGEIVKVVDEHPDVEIGERGDGHPAGNHVLLEIAPSRYALYAHIQAGSVAVEEGQIVETGEVVGKCGNSGNTSQPHLHFQIQNKLDLFDPENQTFPVRFTGVERVRNGRSKRGEAFTLRRNDLLRPISPEL